MRLQAIALTADATQRQQSREYGLAQPQERDEPSLKISPTYPLASPTLFSRVEKGFSSACPLETDQKTGSTDV